MRARDYGLFAGLILAAFVHGIGPLAAEPAKVPTLDTLIETLGYTAADKTALLAGKIISTDVKRTRDDQLIAAVAARIDKPLAVLVENAKRGLNIERDPAVIAFGALSAPAEAGEFGELSYAASESGEVKRLLKVKPSDTFNLSSEEIVFLRERFKGLSARDSAAAETVSQAYRDVLAGRLRAYLDKGLAGIAPYDHGGKAFSPEDELRAVYTQAAPVLSKYFPDFNQALAGFPNDLSPDISSKIYWMKRDIEGRPGFILAHQMVQSGEGFALLSQRQFFVGHTYDSLQVVALALPVEGGTAVFYLNSAFTDKIAGFFSGVAQSVGQSRMKSDLEAYFEIIRSKAQ